MAAIFELSINGIKQGCNFALAITLRWLMGIFKEQPQQQCYKNGPNYIVKPPVSKRKPVVTTYGSRPPFFTKTIL